MAEWDTGVAAEPHSDTVRTDDTLVHMETDNTTRSRFAIYRDKKRGAPVPPLKECGTYAAARRHQRRKEPLCENCRMALNARQRDLYAKRKSANA